MGSQLSYPLRPISQRQLCSLATSRAYNKGRIFFFCSVGDSTHLTRTTVVVFYKIQEPMRVSRSEMARTADEGPSVNPAACGTASGVWCILYNV